MPFFEEGPPRSRNDAAGPRSWWRRGIPWPIGIYAVYIGLVVFGVASLLNRDYRYWYILGPLSIVIGFTVLLAWRRQHPDEFRRRRVEAGYPPHGWISRRRSNTPDSDGSG